MPKKFLFLTLLFLTLAPHLYAAAATVTNNGNIPVRVQYKTPDGQYQDLGQVQPGETVNVPGGVEKVKIVREPGEWAKPLNPGEVLDVVVKEGDQEVGRMDWYGGKVFFDGLTEAPPVTTPTPPAVEPAAPPAAETKPETVPAVEPKTEEPAEETPEQSAENWPWLGGAGNFLFPFQLFLLWLPLIFLAFRQWMRVRYSWGGELRSGGWNWARQGGGGCAMRGLIMGLCLGTFFGGIALLGHAAFLRGETGLLSRAGQDLYALPYFLLAALNINASQFSGIFFILPFWVLVCTSFAGLGGIMPIKGLYSLPVLFMIFPFFLFLRGCSGGSSFAFDGGYGGGDWYPPALAAGGSLVCVITSWLLDWMDPDGEMSWDEEDDVHDAVEDFFYGNPWPLMVILTGGCVTCFYDTAYDFGWNTAIGEFFNDVPALGLGIPPAFSCIFWILMFGTLGWCSFKKPNKLAFYACLFPSLIALMLLSAGNYPQKLKIRDYYNYRAAERAYLDDEREIIRLDPTVMQRIREAAAVADEPVLKGPQPAVSMAPVKDKAWQIGADFGDSFGTAKKRMGLGTDVYFEDTHTENQHDHGHHPEAE